jgi:hypothetical protein
MSHDADHGDEKRESQERFWLPLLMPAAIFLFSVLTIYGLSRIYLELNDWQVGDVTMATPLAIGISIVILAVCALLASRPVPGVVIGMIAVVAAAGLTGGAIWAAVHEEEPSEPQVVSPTPGDGPAPGISVKLNDSPEFIVTLDPSTAPAGPVPFNIENVGSTLHNFRLVATDLAPEDLPYNEDDFVVDESQLDVIEATDDTPYFQIGEHKYGKPIIDRVAQPGMRLGEAAKLALLSFDSTLRSNLSVGLPIDLLIYERDSLDVRREKRIEQDDEYFRKLSSAWSDALRSAFAKIEEFKL